MLRTEFTKLWVTVFLEVNFPVCTVVPVYGGAHLCARTVYKGLPRRRSELLASCS